MTQTSVNTRNRAKQLLARGNITHLRRNGPFPSLLQHDPPIGGQKNIKAATNALPSERLQKGLPHGLTAHQRHTLRHNVASTIPLIQHFNDC